MTKKTKGVKQKVTDRLSYQREWHQNKREDDPEYYEKLKEYKLSWRDKNPEKYLLSNAKQRAKKYNRECTISVDEIDIPHFCPVLGVPLDPIGSGLCYTPSLHRIDSSKGYEPGNVMVISYRANVLLNDGSLEEFIKVIEFLKDDQD